MLTITSKDALSLVVGRRVTVYHHAQTRQTLIHRTQQCHPESTGAGPDRPWASTVSHDASVPSRQENAHTSSYRRSYYESLPSRPRHPQYADLTLNHSTSRLGEPIPDASHPSRRRVIYISM